MGSARKAIVQASGQLQQLQSGDFLDDVIIAPTQQVNDNASTIVIGNAVYVKSNNHIDLAKANAVGTARIFGLVLDTTILTTATGYIQPDGIVTATTGQWDAVTGETGGLTPGAIYYLDAATAGKLTQTAPSTVGQVVVEAGLALKTTEMKILDGKPILL